MKAFILYKIQYNRKVWFEPYLTRFSKYCLELITFIETGLGALAFGVIKNSLCLSHRRS